MENNVIIIGKPLQPKVFTVTENGFSMTDNTVSVPECRITATSFLEAAAILNKFLLTREKPDEIELITPIERINFDS